VPAAAVIPAPIAYIKVVAVKKLVVGSVVSEGRSTLWVCLIFGHERMVRLGALNRSVVSVHQVYFEKIRVLKAGLRLNISCME
jgi:hypothetical protein